MANNIEYPDDLTCNLKNTLEKLKNKHYVTELRRQQEDCGRSKGVNSVSNNTVSIDGVNVHYAQAGNGENIILCLPDVLSTAELDWKLQMERINPLLFTMIALDPPGYGKNIGPHHSRPAFDQDTRRKNAAYADALMVKLGLPRYTVWAVGEGGRTALQMAADFGDHVRNAVLVDTHFYVYKHLFNYFRDAANVHQIAHIDYEEVKNVYDEKYLEETWAAFRQHMMSVYELHSGELVREDVMQKARQPITMLHGGENALIDYKLDQEDAHKKLPKGKEQKTSKRLKSKGEGRKLKQTGKTSSFCDDQLVNQMETQLMPQSKNQGNRSPKKLVQSTPPSARTPVRTPARSPSMSATKGSKASSKGWSRKDKRRTGALKGSGAGGKAGNGSASAETQKMHNDETSRITTKSSLADSKKDRRKLPRFLRRLGGTKDPAMTSTMANDGKQAAGTTSAINNDTGPEPSPKNVRMPQSPRSTSSPPGAVSPTHGGSAPQSPAKKARIGRRGSSGPKARSASSPPTNAFAGGIGGDSKNDGSIVKTSDETTQMEHEAKDPLLTFYEQTIERGCKGVVTEYNEKIRTYLPDPGDMTAFLANASKNRYKDVKCVDTCRVKLIKENPTDNDYIHANFIGTRFICTQGPLESTVVDFWTMVFQQKTPCIIMLCKTIEQNKMKCFDYWPTTLGETKQFGCFTIKMTNDRLRRPDEKQPTKEVVVSVRLELRKEGVAEPWSLVHHQWVSWPDRGVPTDGYMAVYLLNATNHYKVPVVVHCSAGIGRTGSLAVLDLCMDWINAPDDNIPLDVAELTRVVRRQRAHSIQTDLQYLMVHKILLDYCVRQELVKQTAGHKAFNLAYAITTARNAPLD